MISTCKNCQFFDSETDHCIELEVAVGEDVAACDVFREFDQRWYDEHEGEREKIYIPDAKLRVLVTAALADVAARDFRLHIADTEYYCTPLEDAEGIIAASAVDTKTWTAERFDCDDFADVLKAHFAQAAYKDGRRRAAHAFGTCWGIIGGGGHAVNFMINADLQLRIVEPQTDEVMKVADANVAEIWMMKI